MPPIEQLQRLSPLLLERLLHQGVFTSGMLLEVSETRTRRATLADQVGVTTNDIHAWRDEALLLNLASFGPDEQALFSQAGIVGLSGLLHLSLEELKDRIARAARTLGVQPPDELTMEGWHMQARTLEEE